MWTHTLLSPGGHTTLRTHTSQSQTLQQFAFTLHRRGFRHAPKTHGCSLISLLGVHWAKTSSSPLPKPYFIYYLHQNAQRATHAGNQHAGHSGRLRVVGRRYGAVSSPLVVWEWIMEESRSSSGLTRLTLQPHYLSSTRHFHVGGEHLPLVRGRRRQVADSISEGLTKKKQLLVFFSVL